MSSEGRELQEEGDMFLADDWCVTRWSQSNSRLTNIGQFFRTLCDEDPDERQETEDGVTIQRRSRDCAPNRVVFITCEDRI